MIQRRGPRKKEEILPNDGRSDIQKIQIAIMSLGKLPPKYPQLEIYICERLILNDLGGRGTGAEITDWLMATYNVDPSVRKTLSYRVNALVASKSGYFRKVNFKKINGK